MIQLLSVGYRPGAFLPGQHAVLGYPDGVDRDHLGEVTSLVADALDAEMTVVAVYPRWAEEPTRRRLETVRAALDTKRLVLAPTDLPPLAGAVLVSLADGLRAHVDSPGRLIGALPTLTRQVVVMARLTRLSKLHDPAPGAWQHLLSLLPGVAYGVSTFPEPTVRRLSRHQPLMPLPQVRVSAGLGLALAPHGGATLDWAHEHLVPALGHPPVVEARPSPLVARWWGSAPGIEAVLYPTDVATTARHVASGVLLRLCSACGGDSPFDVCPYCGVHEPAPRDDEAGAAADEPTASARPPS